MWRKINDLRGTVNSWHAESGGVISLITLSLPSLTGVFGKKKNPIKWKSLCRTAIHLYVYLYASECTSLTYASPFL